jgi:hypothetical protein
MYPLYSFLLYKIVPLLVYLISVSLCFLIYLLKNKYIPSLNYKIFNFYLNWFFILCYALMHIGLILFLRYKIWGTTLDLGFLFTKYKNHLFMDPLFLVFALLLCLIFFILLSRLNVFLIRQVKMGHLYFKYHNRPSDKDQEKDIKYKLYKIYDRLTINLNNCMEHIYKAKIIIPIIKVIPKLTNLKYIQFYFQENDLILALKYLLNDYVLNFWTYLLFFLFFFECYMNSFVISLTLKYLCFYIIYKFFSNLGLALEAMDEVANKIIHERYYQDDTVYINVSEEEEQFLLNYIRRGLSAYPMPVHLGIKTYWEDINVKVRAKAMFYDVATLTSNNTRYVRNLEVLDRIIFSNIYINKHYEQTPKAIPIYVEGMRKYAYRFI